VKARNPHFADEVRRLYDSAPFIGAIGLCLVDLAPGSCETLIRLERRHLQQDGFVHAGVQATMADHSAGTAAASLIGAGELVLTAEFKINFLEAAQGEELRCRARVLKPGSRLIVAESEVFCLGGGARRFTAKAMVTLAVVSKGRGGGGAQAAPSP
jgi:uncharacterized protein (TIGR00369 family)